MHYVVDATTGAVLEGADPVMSNEVTATGYGALYYACAADSSVSDENASSQNANESATAFTIPAFAVNISKLGWPWRGLGSAWSAQPKRCRSTSRPM